MSRITHVVVGIKGDSMDRYLVRMNESFTNSYTLTDPNGTEEKYT